MLVFRIAALVALILTLTLPASAKKEGGGDPGGGNWIEQNRTPEEIKHLIERAYKVVPQLLNKYEHGASELIVGSLEAFRFFDSKTEGLLIQVAEFYSLHPNHNKPITLKDLKTLPETYYPKNSQYDILFQKINQYSFTVSLYRELLFDSSQNMFSEYAKVKPSGLAFCANGRGEPTDGSNYIVNKESQEVHTSSLSHHHMIRPDKEFCINTTSLDKKFTHADPFPYVAGLLVHELVHRAAWKKDLNDLDSIKMLGFNLSKEIQFEIIENMAVVLEKKTESISNQFDKGLWLDPVIGQFDNFLSILEDAKNIINSHREYSQFFEPQFCSQISISQGLEIRPVIDAIYQTATSGALPFRSKKIVELEYYLHEQAYLLNHFCLNFIIPLMQGDPEFTSFVAETTARFEKSGYFSVTVGQQYLDSFNSTDEEESKYTKLNTEHDKKVIRLLGDLAHRVIVVPGPEGYGPGQPGENYRRFKDTFFTFEENFRALTFELQKVMRQYRTGQYFLKYGIHQPGEEEWVKLHQKSNQ